MTPLALYIYTHILTGQAHQGNPLSSRSHTFSSSRHVARTGAVSYCSANKGESECRFEIQTPCACPPLPSPSRCPPLPAALSFTGHSQRTGKADPTKLQTLASTLCLVDGKKKRQKKSSMRKLLNWSLFFQLRKLYFLVTWELSL